MRLEREAERWIERREGIISEERGYLRQLKRKKRGGRKGRGD